MNTIIKTRKCKTRNKRKGMSNRENQHFYSMGSILLVGGTFFVGRKLVRDAVKKA